MKSSIEIDLVLIANLCNDFTNDVNISDSSEINSTGHVLLQ